MNNVMYYSKLTALESCVNYVVGLGNQRAYEWCKAASCAIARRGKCCLYVCVKWAKTNLEDKHRIFVD